MRIAVDAHGSDNAPLPEIEGAVKAIHENLCELVYLVGQEEVIRKELGKFFYNEKRIIIVDARQIIRMDDAAALSVKAKPDSSLVKTIELHKKGEADAVVSAGNTGAVMAASLFLLGRIKNVHRPAIALNLPTQLNQEIILDVGANVDCEPEHLVHFALLGSLYAKHMLGVDNPRVSLLNIGEEDIKGSRLIKTTYSLLMQEKGLNFIGNIEGKDLLKGITDVVVCDGFVGNIILKTIEGAIISIFDIMKEQFKQDWIAKIGAVLSYPVYSYLKKKLDHTEYGGALLVGLNGLPIVCHGRSNGKAIMNAIKFASKISQSGFVHNVQQHFKEV
jgi:glycerol-3-phosphate acyltransferase PlsX